MIFKTRWAKNRKNIKSKLVGFYLSEELGTIIHLYSLSEEQSTSTTFRNIVLQWLQDDTTDCIQICITKLTEIAQKNWNERKLNIKQSKIKVDFCEFKEQIKIELAPKISISIINKIINNITL